MKEILRIVLLLFSAVCFSCEERFLEEQGLFTNCSECEPADIVRTIIEVRLDKNSSVTILQLWEGNLEDGILLSTSSVNVSGYEYSVSVNKKYTVTATYLLSGKEFVAVDSTIPRVKYTKIQCENPCYFVYDKVVDLRLKSMK